MVIALFALSFVMIVGGAAAVVQGFPYVRLESGLAMVIGGTTAASAGAVLLGIAAVMLQMKKLADVLGRRGREPGSQPELAGPAPTLSVPAFRSPAVEEAPPVGSEPMPATAGAAGLAGLSLGGMRDLLGTGDSSAQADPHPGRTVEVEPPLPNLLPPLADEPVIADEDLFATPEDRPGHGPRAAADTPPEDATAPDPAQEELALRPALDEPPSAPDVEPPVAEMPPATEPEPTPEHDGPKPEDLQVVGTYASGANTYVMFANGTIQADTPRGRFRFQSLDELKAFVDSGGETNARGAA